MLGGQWAYCVAAFFTNARRGLPKTPTMAKLFFVAMEQPQKRRKNLWCPRGACRTSFSREKRPLKLVLERRDPASVLGEELVEMLKRHDFRRGVEFFWRWSHPTKQRANVPQMKLETLDPPISGSDGNGYIRAVPCRMYIGMAGVSVEKLKQVRHTKRSVWNEPAPEDGEGSPASYV